MTKEHDVDDDGACKRCGHHYHLRDGQDPTLLCDECAQIEVERFREALERIHKYQYPFRIGSAGAMQEIAHNALYPRKLVD